MPEGTTRMITGMILLKAIVISVVMYILGIAFLDQLIIASVSATLTGVFVLLAAVITARSMRQTRKEVHDVKQHLGVPDETEE